MSSESSPSSSRVVLDKRLVNPGFDCYKYDLGSILETDSLVTVDFSEELSPITFDSSKLSAMAGMESHSDLFSGSHFAKMDRALRTDYLVHHSADTSKYGLLFFDSKALYRCDFANKSVETVFKVSDAKTCVTGAVHCHKTPDTSDSESLTFAVSLSHFQLALIQLAPISSHKSATAAIVSVEMSDACSADHCMSDFTAECGVLADDSGAIRVVVSYWIDHLKLPTQHIEVLEIQHMDATGVGKAVVSRLHSHSRLVGTKKNVVLHKAFFLSDFDTFHLMSEGGFEVVASEAEEEKMVSESVIEDESRKAQISHKGLGGSKRTSALSRRIELARKRRKLNTAETHSHKHVSFKADSEERADVRSVETAVGDLVDDSHLRRRVVTEAGLSVGATDEGAELDVLETAEDFHEAMTGLSHDSEKHTAVLQSFAVVRALAAESGTSLETVTSIEQMDCVDFYESAEIRGLLSVSEVKLSAVGAEECGGHLYIGAQFNVDMCVFECRFVAGKWRLRNTVLFPGLEMIVATRRERKGTPLNAWDNAHTVAVADFKQFVNVYRLPESPSALRSDSDSVQLRTSATAILGARFVATGHFAVLTKTQLLLFKMH